MGAPYIYIYDVSRLRVKILFVFTLVSFLLAKILLTLLRVPQAAII